MIVVQNRFSELLAIKSRKSGRKITLAEVMEALNVSRPTLEAWVKNDVTRFDGVIIARMCDYFECTICDLLILENIGES